MLFFLTVIGFFSSFFIGLTNPRKAGWAVLLLLPILGPTSFTIVPTNLMPLTFTRVAICVTFGIVVSRYKRDVPLKFILKSTFVKVLLVFTILLILSSTRDNYIYHVFVSHLPNLFCAFVLCFILIKKKQDVEKLAKIFVWQAGLIGFFIILEYYTDFSIGYLLARTNPNFNMYNFYPKESIFAFRLGFYRASGIDGNAVLTAYRLTFLFPLALWYSSGRNALFRIIPLALVSIGLIILQTRAAFVATFIALLILITQLTFTKNMKFFNKFGTIVKTSMLIVLTFSIIIITIPVARNIIISFIEDVKSPVGSTELSLQGKINRIPRAIDYFRSKPIEGYGSPQYVYQELMRYDDIPAPLIYLLSGGIPMFLIYLLMIFYMPYSIFRFSKSNLISDEQKKFLIYASSAFTAGILLVFSSLVETHFWIMYMLYISIYKIYYLKRYATHKTGHSGTQSRTYRLRD